MDMFHEGENIVLGEMDPFLEDWNFAWSNGYLFAEAANRPRRNFAIVHQVDL